MIELATGGIFIGGGIPPRIIESFCRSDFLNSFKNKGAMSHVMENIPVHIILNNKTALLGAAYFLTGKRVN